MTREEYRETIQDAFGFKDGLSTLPPEVIDELAWVVYRWETKQPAPVEYIIERSQLEKLHDILSLVIPVFVRYQPNQLKMAEDAIEILAEAIGQAEYFVQQILYPGAERRRDDWSGEQEKTE